jgi:peptidoglycan hydrolase CwlO-like protein|tara:strand:+ start:302 stop:625 length:324 start_codon:yes stop_codon:yes gene_type:complete
MNLADLLKKNIVMIPVVASVLVGTFTGVKYIVNLTDTINGNQAQIQSIQEMDIVNLQRELKVADGHIQELKQRLERAEATWEMAENLYDLLGQKVNELEWDVKDLNR